MKAFKKATKKAVAIMLCFVMTFGIFAVAGITFDDLSGLFPKAEAAITLGGITQQRVVSNYEATYRAYQKRFFKGEETNWPTNFVIPGLGDADDYTPQGMTYWKAKEWILISAYDAGGSDPSVIYALDVVSTDLVAVFKMQNADGSTNLSHGGGIAASEYNFYYADSGSKISYVPLSEMDVAPGTTKTIRLRDSIDLNKELNGVATSYCCYDEGVLWTGNFYISSDDRYSKKFASDYAQTLMGYKLAGNSSAEEWYYLKNGYNLVKLNSDSPTNNITEGAITYRSYNVDGANAEIRGKITTDTALGEITPTFASVSLTEGKKYKIEFIADNNLSDMYMFAPNGGGHCNVKQSQASKITNLGNGKYHYQMIFTAGLKPAGADSSWSTTQSTNGTYTGTYTIRFDQDSVPAGGRSFNITDFSISEYVEPQGFTPNSKYEGIGCQGNPTYVILLNMDKIQYAMVDKGKIYISRSWSRSHSTNHTRDLTIGDIDLTMPGNENRAINGRTRPVHIIKYENCTHFGGDSSSSSLNQMLYMGEALCVINDYLYMFGESAAYTYRAKEDNKCPEPIDVIWKIDQYAIQGLTRSHEDVASVEYQRVNSLSELNGYDEYIVLYESAIKDPVTQRNVLYLLDANGGYGDTKLPKKASASGITAANTGDTRGIVGYEIKDYSVDGTKLILNAEDDANKSLHWQFESGASTSLRLKNRELYFAKNPYLYLGDSLFAMTTTASSTMKIKDWGNSSFTIYGNGENYSIWCNDGSVPASVTAYTNFYSNHSQSGFAPNYHNLEEIPGTFHITNSGQPALPTSEQQALRIYKRISDPYASSYETQVYTDLDAELTADGTYNITLETYATNALQYQRVDQRPTDFVFVVDVSGSMDQQDAYGYQTDINSWSALTMKQAAGDNNGISENGNYNREWTSNFYYRLPDGEFARISVAVNKGPDGKYSRDIWLWCKHPLTGRCYKISQNGYLVVNNCTGNPSTDSASRITDAMFLANPSAYGYANASEIISEASSDKNRTDYHSERDSQNSRRNYEVLKYPYKDDYGRNVASYYSYGACQRILGVKQAMDKLAVKIQNEANHSGLDHRIAIVTSGSDGTYVSDGRPWANTGILTNSGTWKNYTGGTSLSTADYQSVFFNAKNASNISTIRYYINSQLPCYGHSPINQGLTLASNIINAQKSAGTTYDVNGQRSCVVIVISDGAAGGDNSDYNNATNANNCANDAIGNGGLNLKKNGAYIFSVQIGSQDYVSGFEETDFMKYLSSKYTGSTSMTNPGPLNTKENNYYINVPVGSSFNIDTLANSILNGVVANSNNAIASLNSGAVLREHLTDAFDLTNATITYKTAQSKYDGIGRLYFAAPQTTSGVTATIDKNTNNIEVTGFDYTAKNVSEYNSKDGKGAKLIIEITGVIADADAELLNTSINDTSKTALYQSRSYMSDTLANDKPVKRFPTYHFSIPEYTYYMDYDIPMYDNDVNGTLCSVDSTLQKQSNYKNELSTGNMGIKFMNGNQDMVYTLNSQAGLTEKLSKGYVLIKRDDGTYDWFRLNIVPASTVYYEENKTDTLDGTQSFTEWTTSGSYADKFQSLSSNSDVFGSDETYYNSKDKFSLGTHKEVTVSSAKTNNRSDTQSFTFTGTGFDLISACGNNTGIQTVTVKQHQADGSMKIVRVYLVDTFYNDATYGTVYQVPIVQFKGDYATYTVETTAAYYSFAGGLKTQSVDSQALDNTGIEATTGTVDSIVTDELFAQVGMDELIGQDVELIWMDDDSVLNGGMGADGETLETQADGTSEKSLINYIDGFRIYNPETYNKEYIASEQNASFYSVIDAITAGGMGGNSFAGYLEGGTEGTVFGDYLTSGGPKYEVYLKNNKSLAFRFKTNGNARAMISLRAASGTAKAKIGSKEFVVNSASETYFDITDYITKGSDGTYTVTITNTGSGLLAVDNIKLTNATLSPLNGISLAELDEIISTQAVEINPFEKKAETYTYVNAPADDPDIDPVGSIPTIDEDDEDIIKQNILVNLLTKVFNRVVYFFKLLFQALSLDWLFNII
ncbi:MAG: vWA domain-containing protein [Acutalibacteraceae bacterium]|nr:vWA domain-containing protein [Acutalibacteraceae bacterium]